MRLYKRDPVYLADLIGNKGWFVQRLTRLRFVFGDEDGNKRAEWRDIESFVKLNPSEFMSREVLRACLVPYQECLRSSRYSLLGV